MLWLIGVSWLSLQTFDGITPWCSLSQYHFGLCKTNKQTKILFNLKKVTIAPSKTFISNGDSGCAVFGSYMGAAHYIDFAPSFNLTELYITIYAATIWD